MLRARKYLSVQARLRRPGLLTPLAAAVPSALRLHQQGAATGSLTGDVHARHITAFALRGGATVVGAVSAYVLYQVWQRLDMNQKRRIRASILEPAVQGMNPGVLFLQRPEKHAFMTELFYSDPGRPIVVTGPQGSGKTMIIKRALSARPNSLYLDLRASPVSDGTSLAVNLVTQAGYLLPPNELLGRAIFTRDALGTQQTLSQEIDRAFRLITDVLREEKAKRWPVTMPDGRTRIVPPLLCIDELNLTTADANALTEDPMFWRFVDWTLFLTDNRLAHVVFSTSLDVAEMMDNYAGFRVRRQKVHIDFPRQASILVYFHHTLNPFLQNVLGAAPRTPPALPASAEPAAASAAAPAPEVAAAVPAAPPATALETAARAAPLLPQQPSLWSRFWLGEQEAARRASLLLAAQPISGTHSAVDASAGSTVKSNDSSAVKAATDAAVSAAQQPASAADDISAHVETQLAKMREQALEQQKAKEGQAAAANTTAAAAPPAAAAPAVIAVKEAAPAPPPPPPPPPPPTTHVDALADGEGPSAVMAVARAAELAAAKQQAEAAAKAPAAEARGAAEAAPSSGGAATAGSTQGQTSSDSATGTTPVSSASATTTASTASAPSSAGPANAGSTAGSSVASGSQAAAAATAVTAPATEPAAPTPAASARPASLSGFYLLDDWEIDKIVEVIGGHLKDLDTVVTAITTGKHWTGALERLVADSVEQVERTLEQLFMTQDGLGSAPSVTGSSAAGAAGARRVPRARALSATAATRGSGLPLPHWDFDVNPRPERLAAYQRYLRAWAMISELATRKYIAKREIAERVFTGCPHEIDIMADAGLIMIINVKAATKISSPAPSATGTMHGKGAGYLLEASLPGTYITASSPRMRMAFRALVSDPRLQAQTTRIRTAVKLARLQDEESILLRRMPEALAERAYWQTQVNILMSRDTALRTSVAKELVNMQAAAPVTGAAFLQQGTLDPAVAPSASLDANNTAAESQPADKAQAGAAPADVAAASASATATPTATGSTATLSASTSSVVAAPSGATTSTGASARAGDRQTLLPQADLPLLGVRFLLAALENAQQELQRSESEVAATRSKLAELRAGITKARAELQVQLPHDDKDKESEDRERDDRRAKDQAVDIAVDGITSSRNTGGVSGSPQSSGGDGRSGTGMLSGSVSLGAGGVGFSGYSPYAVFTYGASSAAAGGFAPAPATNGSASNGTGSNSDDRDTADSSSSRSTGSGRSPGSRFLYGEAGWANGGATPAPAPADPYSYHGEEEQRSGRNSGDDDESDSQRSQYPYGPRRRNEIHRGRRTRKQPEDGNAQQPNGSSDNDTPITQGPYRWWL